MGKLRQWFRMWFDRQIEKSMQRQANRMFDKSRIKYRDGDNT
jgi:heme O synthase-like polyprenyltransferase